MLDKLDKTDLKIFEILQQNSKITNLDLSKRIGLSPAPTLERVKKLEQNNIIESYHAKVNSQAMGLHVKTFVLVSLAWQKENALENFLKQIESIKEITECYIITGDADFLLKIVCKDLPSYEQLLFKTLSQIEQIERLKTLMTLSTVKEQKVLPPRLRIANLFQGMIRNGSLLWKIQKSDSPCTSYLFGTMHTRDLHARSIAAGILPWLENVDRFTAELPLDQGLHARIIPGFQNQKGMKLSDSFSQRSFQKYRDILLKSFGVDMKSYDSMIPFAVISAISDCAIHPVYRRSQDKYLWDHAVSMGLVCDGLETPEEQLEVLEQYAYADQLRDLVRIAKNVSRFRQKINRLSRCYRDGRLHRLTMLSRQGLGNFRFALVDHRNAVMADRISSLALDKNTMFAIGAGHLSGYSGILSRLKKAGYSVVPVAFRY